MRSFFPALSAVSALAFVATPLFGQAGTPAGPVPVGLLQARRDSLFAKMGTGVAIVQSSQERGEPDYAQDSDYRENDNFFYLTGIEAKDSWLILVARDTAPDQAFLLLPPRNPAAERWTGAQLGPGAEATQLTGIAEVHSADSLQTMVRRAMFAARGAPLYIPRDAKAGQSAFYRDLVFGGGGGRVENLARLMGQLRVVKDADELRRMRRSIGITTEAQLAGMAAAKPGMHEYEIESVIEATFRRSGAERVSFPTIVGSGLNSTTLHYDKNRRETRAGDLVVMDIGAEYGYYAADVTRTIPISGKFTPRQRQIYDLVLATQQDAIDSIRPGMTIGRLNAISRNYMKAHSGNLCGEAGCDRYYIHGLSHWLGMDVHDVGGDVPFAPGMVLTVEPGIYIPDEALGVRIEDDLLVTATGSELLSAGAPRKADDVEKAMRKR